MTITNKVTQFLEDKGFTHIVVVEDNQNFLWLEGRTPKGIPCEFKYIKSINEAWDRTGRFWDIIGEVI